MTKIQKAIPSLIISLFGIILFLIFIPNNINILEGNFINARFFPYILAVAIIIFSTIDFISLLLSDNKREREKIKTKKSHKDFSKYARVILTLLCCIFWTVVISYIGYIITTLLIIVLLMLIFGNKNWKQISLTSLLFTILSFYIFSDILNVSLPQGTLL